MHAAEIFKELQRSPTAHIKNEANCICKMWFILARETTTTFAERDPLCNECKKMDKG